MWYLLAFVVGLVIFPAWRAIVDWLQGCPECGHNSLVGLDGHKRCANCDGRNDEIA